MTAPAGLGEREIEAARAVLDQAVVVQRVPRPRLGEWWGEVVARAVEALARLLRLDSSSVRLLLEIGAWAIVGLAVLALLRLAWSWWRRSGSAPEAGPLETVPAPTRQREAAGWARRLDEALAAGDVPGALEALWFVVALRVQPSLLEGDRRWTGSVLLEAAGSARQALEPLVRSLERWTYGGAHPSVADLEATRERLDRIQASPTGAPS